MTSAAREGSKHQGTLKPRKVWRKKSVPKGSHPFFPFHNELQTLSKITNRKKQCPDKTQRIKKPKDLNTFLLPSP